MEFVRNVLLIDDNSNCNFIMSEFIKLADETIRVISAESVEEAMEALKVAGADFPDVIYVDINMPLQNGFEFVELYEEQFMALHPRTRLFMLSSSLRLDDREKAMAYDSVDDFVSKNDIDEFLKITLSKRVA
jgi:response regulator RpfG family c-di-GMP phosphodiesterase